MKISNTGILSIGDNVFISANTNIICTDRIEIGDACNISWQCLFMDSDFHKIYDRSSGLQINQQEPIYIGNHVWIGCNCIILKGTHIGESIVIAAGSVIAKELKESHCIYTSSTCLKRNIEWSN